MVVAATSAWISISRVQCSVNEGQRQLTAPNMTCVKIRNIGLLFTRNEPSMSRHDWTLAIFVWFLFVTAAEAQVSGTADPLFQNLDVVEVRLVAPIAAIMSNRKESEQFDGKLLHIDAAGTSTELDVEIRTRGRFRLQKSVCPFAPLRLNFKKSQTEGSLFAGQDKLKLVTHCKNRSKRYEQALLREYLAYRILNELTDISFRVRLLKITYEDTDVRKPQQTTYGFVVENKDRLAERVALTALDIERTGVSALQPRFMNLVSVFQFLIGNTDFSPIAGATDTCCHNHVLLGRDSELAYSVPYDFDQAGLVNAPHAEANSRFRLRSVRQRLYRGRCQNNQFIDESLKEYQQRRAAILKLPSEPAGLTEATRKTLERYIAQFYEIIDSPGRINKLLVRKCI